MHPVGCFIRKNFIEVVFMLCCEHTDGWLTEWQNFRTDMLNKGLVHAAGCVGWS
jgi:hypothetical protein